MIMRSPVESLVIDPPGRTLAAVDDAGLIHLWDRSSGREKVLAPDDLKRRRDRVQLAFSGDGTRLATTSHGKPGRPPAGGRLGRRFGPPGRSAPQPGIKTPAS